MGLYLFIFLYFLLFIIYFLKILLLFKDSHHNTHIIIK